MVCYFSQLQVNASVVLHGYDFLFVPARCCVRASVERRRMKVIERTAAILFVAFLIWIAASWGDALLHNDPFDGDQHYGRWNAFLIMTEVEP